MRNQDADAVLGKSSRAWYLGYAAAELALWVATPTEKGIEGDSYLHFTL